MRPVIALAKSLTSVAALVLLASCSETPSKPTTSGGASSGSGKVVTATPEEPFECDDDLILEPHLPEECIPPEPPEPVVQKPVEPPKPDPIVGTYVNLPLNHPNSRSVWRIFPDGTATTNTRANELWELKDGEYHFRNANGGNPLHVVTIQSLAGEPDLVGRPPVGVTWSYSDTEAIKLSEDPLYSFDFYILGVDGFEWGCYNVGRGEKQKGIVSYPGHPKHTSDSLEECEALCPALMAYKYSHPNWLRSTGQSLVQETLARATCPQDRR